MDYVVDLQVGSATNEVELACEISMKSMRLNSRNKKGVYLLAMASLVLK